MIKSRGFTLIELLVAMGIGMAVLLLAVSGLNSASQGYGRNTDGITSEREARATLTKIAEDLSGAVWHEDTLLVNEDQPRARDQLGFLMLQPADAQREEEHIGDLCATVYYLKDLSYGGRTVRCLMRGFHGSQETFEALRDDDVASLFKERDADEPIAFGVLAFDVQALRRTADGGWEPLPATELEARTGAPEALKLNLLLARRELSGKLQNSQDWDESPLIPSPEGVDESKYVETYEIVQAFAHPL